MTAKSAPDLSWADDAPLRSAVVVYESRFGKTRQVAEALARGVRREGVLADVLPVSEAEQRPIDGYDLLIVGSPSNHLAASPGMRSFLETLKRMPRLKGRYGFAFDTRVRHRSGGAGRQIESALVRLGLRIPGPRAHALVDPPSHLTTGTEAGPSDSEEFHLEAGTEDRFEALGARLVRTIRGEDEKVTG
jgi:flavorubredoxin